MTKYFTYKDKQYKAVLWTSSKLMGFSVVEWPDFEWSQTGCIMPKPITQFTKPNKKVQSIDYYIERWKEQQREQETLM